jgi:predicted nucleic-acid-binding protein
LSLGGALDTNILVRLLVRDDAIQTDLAASLLERHARKSEALLVPVSVMLELEWVLRSRYKFSKAEVIRTFTGLLASIELVFESEAALEQALASYEDGAADFGEFLHLALAQQGQALPFWTFDAKASKAPGTRLLKSQ